MLLTVLLPATLSAKKKNNVVTNNRSLLTLNEQHYFDSIYFKAITEQQCQRTDKAIELMNQAVQYYNIKITAKGYEVKMEIPDYMKEFLEGKNSGKKKEAERPTPNTRQVPGLAAAYYFLSNRYREQNNALQTLINIQMAVAIDSINYWYTEEEGSLYLALKQLPEARECYERLVRQYPTKSEPLYSMAEIYLRLDSVNLCLKTLDKLEEIEGVSPGLTQWKFAILQEKGRTEEGFDQYRKLIERYPFNVQYRIKMGDLQMQNGQIPQAKQTYDAASAIEPDNAYVWVAQANYYNMTGDQLAADSLVSSALTNTNLDLDTKKQVMEEYLRGSFRKLSLYRDALNRGDRSAQFDTIRLFITVDSLFMNIVAQHPSADQMYELQYEWRSAMGQDSLASESMRYAVNLKPTSQEYWDRLLTQATTWMPKEKILTLTQEALAIDSTMQSAYMVAAWAYIQMEKYPEAIEQNMLAIKHMEPLDANRVSSLWGSIGDLYHEIGQMDKVYDCYETAIKYNPQNYNILNNYAYYLSEENRDLTKAEQMSLKVVQKEPKNPTYLDTYAWILYLEGSYPLAIFYQEQAIENTDPNGAGNSTLYDHYGDMLVKNNDLKAAIEQWRKAISCIDCPPDDFTRIQQKIENAESLLQ